MTTIIRDGVPVELTPEQAAEFEASRGPPQPPFVPPTKDQRIDAELAASLTLDALIDEIAAARGQTRNAVLQRIEARP